MCLFASEASPRRAGACEPWLLIYRPVACLAQWGAPLPPIGRISGSIQVGPKMEIIFKKLFKYNFFEPLKKVLLAMFVWYGYFSLFECTYCRSLWTRESPLITKIEMLKIMGVVRNIEGTGDKGHTKLSSVLDKDETECNITFYQFETIWSWLGCFKGP